MQEKELKEKFRVHCKLHNLNYGRLMWQINNINYMSDKNAA